MRIRSRIPTICNTLRRILEHYFKFLGGISLHDLHENFDDDEKLICHSLTSWINAGSHLVPDDLHVSQAPETTAKYLDVFRRIFVAQGMKRITV